MFEAVFVGRSRAQHAALSAVERSDADRSIHQIELNPWIDGTTKISYLMAPLIFTLYDDDRWRIVYRLVDERFVEIFSITRSCTR